MKRVSFVLFILFAFSIGLQARVIKVLTIGNSFSEDAVEHYLYELAFAQGDTLIIGNACIGGCTIDRHYNNAQTGEKAYSYRKIVDGVRTEKNGVDLKSAIQDEAWDYISLQQVSQDSGRPETFGNLKNLKDYVMSQATNKNVEIIWHLTWAYAANSTHGGFKNYDNNQMKMYKAILKTRKQELPKVGIKKVVPSGIAIQKARKMVGDILNRDGFHLDMSLGRYTAACAWCEFLTKKSVKGNPYFPDTIQREQAMKVQKAAHKAFKSL